MRQLAYFWLMFPKPLMLILQKIVRTMIGLGQMEKEWESLGVKARLAGGMQEWHVLMAPLVNTLAFHYDPSTHLPATSQDTQIRRRRQVNKTRWLTGGTGWREWFLSAPMNYKNLHPNPVHDQQSEKTSVGIADAVAGVSCPLCHSKGSKETIRVCLSYCLIAG